MSLPRISQGIGALTPEVWDKMMEAIRLSGADKPGTTQEKKRERDPFEQHWSLCGTFLARLKFSVEIPGEDFRWSYGWTHFVPFVNDDDFFKLADQPGDLGSHEGEGITEHHTQDGAIAEPYLRLQGGPNSHTHIVGDIPEYPVLQPYPCAYNLAEWNNTESYANGVNIGAATWPAGFELQPICNSSALPHSPLVVMHWTRYIYSEEGDKRSRVLFFFDRQNHFDGGC